MAIKRFYWGTVGFLVVAAVAVAFASAADIDTTRQAPVWQPANLNGFGDPQAVEVSALAAFNGQLYAGIRNPTGGSRIYRWQGGTSWTPVSQAGFGIGTDTRPIAILDLTVFNNSLYASTGLKENAGQIWRSANGTTWAPMEIAGFSDPDSVDITALFEFNGYLYAGVTNRATGAQIWRSSSGDNNTWTQVAPTAPGADRARVTGFAVYGGALYAAVESAGPAQIWRYDGVDWTTVVSDGFGDSATVLTGGLAEFAGYLYVGAGNSNEGAQLWRTNDATNWAQIITPAFGDANNETIDAVFVSQDQLYVSTRNVITGLELWRSANAAQWEQANVDGFGDSNNVGSNLNSATASFQGYLYVGTSNEVAGGEVWRTQLQQQHTYLPVVVR